MSSSSVARRDRSYDQSLGRGVHPDIGRVTFADAAAQAELVVNATARGVEMWLPLWLRVMGALGTRSSTSRWFADLPVRGGPRGPCSMTPVDHRIDRVDPLDLDLDLADALADLFTASERTDGVPFQAKVGPDLLTARRWGSDSRPLDAMFVAWDRDRPVAEATVDLPWRDNADSASVRVRVHPDARGRGLGRDLWQRAVGVAREQGRTRVHAGAWLGGPGVAVLDHWGLARTSVGVIRRVDVHGTPRSTWDRLYDEALDVADGYELVQQVGSTPSDRVEALVALHDAINDAPSSDPDDEPDAWDAQRLADYEGAMAGRRQSLYRVMARHSATGAWAGQSMLCVNEFSPAEAFQEDTSVVRAHRGHRLGLLMKAAMLRWVGDERPEVGAIDTWNAANNHHMIAINERLGATVVARHQGFRADV